MSHLYMDEKTKKSFEDGEWCKSHKRQGSNAEIIADNAVVLPPMPAINRFNLGDVEVGVLDKFRKYIAGTGMSEMKFLDFDIPEDVPYIDKTVIWGGLLYCHYGHFLLQSTTRLYYYLKNKEKHIPIVFSVLNHNVPRYISDFLHLCDIPESDVIFLDKMTRFKEVICPELSSVYYKDWTDDFVLPFREAAKNVVAAPYEKVFFSRKHWKGMAKCLGEEAIEKAFNENGFHSVEMEKLSLHEQIAVIKGAEVLAGINGTAFHNILFSSKQELIILNRNEEYDSQYIVNEAAEAKCSVVKVYANPLPVTHPNGPFIVGITEYLSQFFKDHGFKNSQKAFNPNKYVGKFWKLYQENYMQSNLYGELCFRHKQNVDIMDVFYVMNLANRSVFKTFGVYLLSKVTFGTTRRYFKSKYKSLKKLKSVSIDFKY